MMSVATKDGGRCSVTFASRARTGPRSVGGDDGTIGLLTLGMVVLALALVLVVSAATTVHSAHMRLATIADELALDAADAADLDAYYSGDAAQLLGAESGGVVLSGERMRTEIAERIANSPLRLGDVRVVSVATPDGRTAVVTVGVTVHPMLGAEGILPFLSGVNLTATGTARSS